MYMYIIHKLLDIYDFIMTQDAIGKRIRKRELLVKNIQSKSVDKSYATNYCELTTQQLSI